MQWFTFLSVLYLCGSAKCDIFSSTAHLENLLHLERHIATFLHNYMDAMHRKLEHVRSYLDEFSRTTGYHYYIASDDASSDLVKNPLQAFQLVKRLTIDWTNLRNLMMTNDWYRIEQLVNENKVLMPQNEDLHGAALALVRLQDTYKLNTSDMARGALLGIQSPVGLTARDCLYLGKQSFNNGYYGRAIEWLEEAYTTAHLEGNLTATVDEVLPFLQSAIKVHDDLFESTEYDAAVYDTMGFPYQHTAVEDRPNPDAPRKVTLGFNTTNDDDYTNYVDLCRGIKLRDIKYESDLYCRLTTRNSPYLLLQPLRMEEISLDPYIVRFHNLMTDGEAEFLKKHVMPKLSRSLVQANSGGEEVSYTRTSQNGWVSPFDHPVAANINKKVSLASQLSTDVERDHSEMVQVANYGMGGHYTPHFDYLIVDKTPEELAKVHPKELLSGDRTATLMFYLSDVIRGGSTVFPRVGVGVKPIKGSAVFWFNLRKNGEGHNLTLHGACPVLYGEKWVANYWIRSCGQMLTRPCSINPDE